MRFYFFGILLLLSFMLRGRMEASEASEASELNQKAWSEYNFAVFESAQKYFLEASRLKSATPEEYCQAMTGLAFCIQYGLKDNASVSDLRHAIFYYEKAIAKVGPSSKYIPFLKSMIAECNFMIYNKSGDKSSLHKAEELWAELLSKDRYCIVSQDALLFKTVAGIKNLNSKESEEKLFEMDKYVQEVVSKIPNDKAIGELSEQYFITSAMAFILGNAYVHRREYEKAFNAYKNYLKLGPTSQRSKSEVIFKLARIAELELKNIDFAVEYYELFYTIDPNNIKTYFAQQKAKELKTAE